MEALVYDTGPVRWIACKAAGCITPAAYWSRLSGLRLARVPIPALPSPAWVRLRPILGGICGTDLAAITQRQHPASILQAFSSLPAVLGHENVSIVEEVGPAVTGWRPGDRVVVEPTLSCLPRGIEPICPQCEAGRFTICENFREGPLPIGSMIGWNSFTGGSWAPFFVAHESQLHAVPAEISDEEAVLTDPVAGALHAVLRHPPAADQTVLILGAGLLGIGVAASIRALEGAARVLPASESPWVNEAGETPGTQGRPRPSHTPSRADRNQSACRLVAIIRHENQRELMQRFGANETIRIGRKDSQAVRYGRVAERIGGKAFPSRLGHHALTGGFDLVYDCIGTGQSLTDAMKYARSGGTVVEVGTSGITTVDTAPLWFNELNLIGANGRAIEHYDGRRLHTYEIVFEMMRQRRLDLSGLLTHRFRIEEDRTALATLVHRGSSGAIKVAFEQSSNPGIRAG